MSGYKEIPGPIEGYKIFNDDMTCRDFQFKMGMNELGNSDPLILCENGFHFCKYPSGVWAYYETGRVFRIRAYDVLNHPIVPGAACKMVCRKIEIVEEVFPNGNGNTGHRNTGSRNTGDGNCGNRNPGFFCLGDAPVVFFGKKVDDGVGIDWGLAHQLGAKLSSDEPFDAAPYLSLPNATKAYIKRLHKAHIEARKRAKA